VLANSFPSPPGLDLARLAHDIAAYYLGEQLAAAPANQQSAGISSAMLDAIAGRYDYGPVILIVTMEAGRLYSQLAGQPRKQLFPKSETEYFWQGSDARLIFIKDPNGKVTQAVQYQDGYTIHAPRLETLDVAAIDAIAGRYDCSRRTRSILAVTREKDRVYAELTGQPAYEIFPRSATRFYSKVLKADLTFTSDGVIKHQDGETVLCRPVR
jgi:hypothetical protein